MTFKIPSDDTIIQLSHKDSKGDMVFKYLNSRSGKKDLTLTNEQLQSAIKKGTFKQIP